MSDLIAQILASRIVPVVVVNDAARAAGLAAETAPSVAAALAAIAARNPEARVLICGSLYLAGAVLTANGTPPV